MPASPFTHECFRPEELSQEERNLYVAPEDIQNRLFPKGLRVFDIRVQMMFVSTECTRQNFIQNVCFNYRAKLLNTGL